MKQFYGYIRVSTVKQGEHGVSLEQQRAAIERYVKQHDLSLVRWFEEQETAAKRGRPVFNQMLKLLRLGKAAGVVIHKIDRSARNLKDWADLGELIDAGLEVQFANEALDLSSRGGRLSADIQAVVAADYIRNLREETKKGFYGRLKQGLYPRPAPLGYQDQGRGKVKTPDPIRGPLIQTAFDLYGSGRFNLEDLAEELGILGLRSKSGKSVSISMLSRILNNPFYTGLISIEKTGQTFEGRHQTLVPLALYRRVQDLLRGKVGRKSKKYTLLYRQLFRCGHCSRCLIGEVKKGHTYYRCHSKGCPSRTAREEAMESSIIHQLIRLEYGQGEKDYVRAKILRMRLGWQQQRDVTDAALKLKLSQVEERQNRLTDAYLDQTIDKVAFEQRKAALLQERREIQDRMDFLKDGGISLPDRLTELVELAGSAYLAYKFAIAEEKRDLVKKLSSNRTLTGKSLKVVLDSPFDLIANRFAIPCGSPSHTTGRDVGKIWDILLPKLIAALPAPNQLRNNTP